MTMSRKVLLGFVVAVLPLLAHTQSIPAASDRGQKEAKAVIDMVGVIENVTNLHRTINNLGSGSGLGNRIGVFNLAGVPPYGNDAGGFFYAGYIRSKYCSTTGSAAYTAASSVVPIATNPDGTFTWRFSSVYDSNLTITCHFNGTAGLFNGTVTTSTDGITDYNAATYQSALGTMTRDGTRYECFYHRMAGGHEPVEVEAGQKPNCSIIPGVYNEWGPSYPTRYSLTLPVMQLNGPIKTLDPIRGEYSNSGVYAGPKIEYKACAIGLTDAQARAFTNYPTPCLY